MASMNETLQQLVQRRMRELGGSSGPISTRQVWLRGGEEGWSYETVRRIVENGHQKIGDRVADKLAVALDTTVSSILTAAGQRPRLGRFELPRRADRLSESERSAVMGVVDAILDAAEHPDASVTELKPVSAHGARTSPVRRSGRSDPAGTPSKDVAALELPGAAKDRRGDDQR